MLEFESEMFPKSHPHFVKGLVLHWELLGSNKNFKRWGLVGDNWASEGMSLRVQGPSSTLHFLACCS